MFNREYYKPFQFPWAYEYYKAQHQMHWLPEEVPMHADAGDWNTLLNDSERKFLSMILRFFTQADVDVAGGYYDIYLPQFKAPELRMMMGAFAAMEGVHMDAYSTLIETIGMPESEYQMFQQHQEMLDKHDFLKQFRDSDPLLALAGYSAFTEGLQLFASFVMLLNFQRFNKMKNMCQIVAWSIRDESLHVEGMTRLFTDIMRIEGRENDIDLQLKIRDICAQSVKLEDAFIDLVFGGFDIEGISKVEVKEYIRKIANIRMQQLGQQPMYELTMKNPLPWVDEIVFGTEHTNFFENRSTSYAKSASSGSWDEVWSTVDAST